MKRLLGVLAIAAAVIGVNLSAARAVTVSVQRAEPNVTVEEPGDPGIPGIEVDNFDEKEAPEGVTALYGGELINLMDGWGGAQICSVYSPSDVRCYDTQAQMLTDLGEAAFEGTYSPSDACPRGWACIWEHRDYNAAQSGRMLKFRDAGPKQGLGQYGFRDMASSVRNRLPGDATFKLTDYKTFWYDQNLTYRSGSRDPHFFDNPDYADGGHWNDKADAVTIKRP